MKIIYALALAPLLLAGCKEAVPVVSDVSNIVVDGKQYKPVEFIRTFCQAQESRSDENCIKVEKKMLDDQTRIINIQPE